MGLRTGIETAASLAVVAVGACIFVVAAKHHWAEPSTMWAGLGSAATLVTAVAAVWTLVALRQDSRDRTRPMMVAELKPSVLTDNAELHITNAGPSVAQNVKVDFDPPLPVLTGAEADGKLTPFLQRRYERVIPTFTPGMVMDNLYQDATEPDEPVPDDFAVKFTYSDTRGRRYTDAYFLSLETLRNQTGAYPSTRGEDGERRRTVKAIESIARGIGRA
jgi:hypothetical protein